MHAGIDILVVHTARDIALPTTRPDNVIYRHIAMANVLQRFSDALPHAWPPGSHIIQSILPI